MLRKAGSKSATRIYHIMVIGINRQDIFQDEEDKGVYLVRRCQENRPLDNISSTFKDGSTVGDMANGLKSGKINPNDVPAIRILEKNGAIYSLDNRRLYAFQQAGISNIPYKWATPQEILNEAWKFTTTNGGRSITVRGQ